VIPAAPGTLAYRLDRSDRARAWDSGLGAKLDGGRWNPEGVACVYASFASATAILEVAVHKGFDAINRVAHTLTQFEILDPADLRVVPPAAVPNANWLVPGALSAGQQEFGRRLLEAHLFVAVPSVVAPVSWNLIFDPARCAGRYALRAQSSFALDPRIDPPRARR
jgi:RES domain-containing protein